MSRQSWRWGGSFGDIYHKRNESENRDEFWHNALKAIDYQVCVPDSVFEPGAGKGANIEAIAGNFAMRRDGCFAVEVNPNACDSLRKAGISFINDTFLDAKIERKFDLVITRGFLIHVPEDELALTLEKIYSLSCNYICIAEYYSPERRSIKYRGYDNMLWLDDFAGIMLDMHDDLELIDYGFCYGRLGGYDLTYFLMRKN